MVEFQLGFPYSFPEMDFDHYMKMAKLAEDLGFETLSMADHMLLPDRLRSAYRVWDSDAQITGSYECIATLAALSAVTSRIRIKTGVLIPLRNPLEIANATSTLDHISKGRLVVGLGAGYSKPEFDAFAVPYDKRGRIEDELIRILLELWTKETVTFHGKFFDLNAVTPAVRPVQKPHPPVWLGGASEQTLRRVVKYADGWMPSHIEVERFSEVVRSLKAMLKDAGRPSNEIKIVAYFNCCIRESNDDALQASELLATLWNMSHKAALGKAIVGGPEECVMRIEEYVQAGATAISVRFVPFGNELNDMSLFAESVMKRF